MAQQLSIPTDLHDEKFASISTALFVDGFDEEVCDRLCQEFLARLPADAEDREMFAEKYRRHCRWYARQNVSPDDELFLYFLFLLQLPRAVRLQEDDTSIYVRYINWFVENEFDQRNRFHNGFADDLDDEPGPDRDSTSALLLDCLEYLSLLSEQEDGVDDFRVGEQQYRAWCARTRGDSDQFLSCEEKFARWAVGSRFQETNPLLRYVTFVNWFTVNNFLPAFNPSGSG